MSQKSVKSGARGLLDGSTRLRRNNSRISLGSQQNGKKKQSSLNKPGSSTSRAPKSMDSADSMFLPPGYYEWEGQEEYEGSSKLKIHKSFSRTSMLLRDYREFKAARTIQSALRGWFTRHMLAKKTRAALIIQRAWRGFIAKHHYFQKLEQTLQARIIEHFHRSATKIQALWRGYWVRENVHDHYRLTRMQVRAAEDLLHCVAFKLHHMLRTHQIPGVYSLRNSNCLSKVEKLLAAMNFKVHNERVRVARTRREQAIQVAKKKHCESKYQTTIPYAGPDLGGLCEPKCCALYKEEDADKKMFKILSLYEKAMRTDPRLRRIRNQPKSRGKPAAPKVKKKKPKPGNDFCADIVKCMQRWNILGDNSVSVKPDVFRTPENVESFLMEIQSFTSFVKGRCHCYMKPEEYEKCM